MLEDKAVIGETDMLQPKQQHAVSLAAKALDYLEVTDSTEIARYIKKEFDRKYGMGWGGNEWLERTSGLLSPTAMAASSTFASVALPSSSSKELQGLRPTGDSISCKGDDATAESLPSKKWRL